jgi:hypothetical protein
MLIAIVALLVVAGVAIIILTSRPVPPTEEAEVVENVQIENVEVVENVQIENVEVVENVQIPTPEEAAAALKGVQPENVRVSFAEQMPPGPENENLLAVGAWVTENATLCFVYSAATGEVENTYVDYVAENEEVAWLMSLLEGEISRVTGNEIVPYDFEPWEDNAYLFTYCDGYSELRGWTWGQAIFYLENMWIEGL